MSLTTAALLSATAAPAPALASAHPAARTSVLALTCEPSAGIKAYYSPKKWSKGNARLCVKVLQRDDGRKAIQADYFAELFYYRGVGWWADCSTPCTVRGGFTLRKNGRLLNETNFGNEVLSGNGVHAPQTFDADSGHFQVTAAANKLGGYWDYDDQEEEVNMTNLTVEVDVP
jgi:hypothetical protein